MTDRQEQIQDNQRKHIAAAITQSRKAEDLMVSARHNLARQLATGYDLGLTDKDMAELMVEDLASTRASRRYGRKQ